MAAQSYRNLLVWQKSYALAIDVYKLTEQLPEIEKYGLITQMRRCAISIPSNIAEGQQRNNVKEYVQFLGIARGSAAELSTQLMLARDVYGVKLDLLLDEVEQVQKMLYALIQKLEPVSYNLYLGRSHFG